MHAGAIDFIKDWKKTIGINGFCYRIQDIYIPIDSFFKFAEPFEKHLFSAAVVDDPLFFSNTQSLADMFDKLQTERNNQTKAYYDFLSNWKKAIILFLIDRKELKKKVKNKLKFHPLLLKVCKVTYSIPRGFYHLFRGSRQ